MLTVFFALISSFGFGLIIGSKYLPNLDVDEKAYKDGINAGVLLRAARNSASEAKR